MLCLVAGSLAFQLSPAPRPSGAASRIAAMADVLDNVEIDKPLSPLGNQVLVQLSKDDDQTNGGLFLPDSATEKPMEGTVLSVGPGAIHRLSGASVPNPIAPGDVVLLAEGVGESVVFNEAKCVFCDAADVLGKFEGGAMTLGSFEPTFDHILVKGEDMATETATGIALALDKNPNENKGEVMAVGAGKLNSQGSAMPMPVAVGEQLLYAEGAGFEAEIEGKVYKVVSSDDCIAKW